MELITDTEEASELMRLPIMDKAESFELTESTFFDWEVLGSMQLTKKQWEYGFRIAAKITMYCRELELRRFPTGQELDEIKDLDLI